MDELNRLIDSRSGFQDALNIAFENMNRAGSRQVLMCDEDYLDWPLGAPETIVRLSAWAQPHRELHVVARTFDGLARQHPRWVTWRRHRSHVVRCRSPSEHLETAGGGAVVLPTLLIIPGLLALRLTDQARFRGRLTTHAGDIESLRQQFDALSQQSFDSFAVTTLGL